MNPHTHLPNPQSLVPSPYFTGTPLRFGNCDKNDSSFKIVIFKGDVYSGLFGDTVDITGWWQQLVQQGI
ncbi:hypothetical protein [Nostoc sp. CALU 1950]|uniref:hypothetical protein n=1 Tax=Nostoc sp. CALU 1950 TaxID=3104321 RepID=UPI003EBCFD7C